MKTWESNFGSHLNWHKSRLSWIWSFGLKLYKLFAHPACWQILNGSPVYSVGQLSYHADQTDLPINLVFLVCECAGSWGKWRTPNDSSSPSADMGTNREAEKATASYYFLCVGGCFKIYYLIQINWLDVLISTSQWMRSDKISTSIDGMGIIISNITAKYWAVIQIGPK